MPLHPSLEKHSEPKLESQRAGLEAAATPGRRKGGAKARSREHWPGVTFPSTRLPASALGLAPAS